MKRGISSCAAGLFALAAFCLPARAEDSVISFVSGPFAGAAAERVSQVSLPVPEVQEILSPIVSVVPLQLLAYHVAKARGLNVDKPRNLAKSVTVE